MNPFVITGSVPDEYFCDRRDEAERIIRTVTNGDNLCLISPRRMGKSKLIDFCYGKPQLRKNYHTFYIDILHTKSLQEFTYCFGRSVFDQLATKSRKMMTALLACLKSVNAKLGFDPVSGLPVFNLELGDIVRPDYTLSEIFEYLEHADKPCIVTFDEFQQISKYPEENMEAMLRSHIQRTGNCNFIFSGSERHLVSQMFLASARPFYHSASIMELAPIPLPEYTSFVISHFENGGRMISEDVIKKVYDLYDGNTYCIQKTFHEAYDSVPPGQECTLSDIVSVTDSILEENGTGYRLMLSEIPTRQKELLYAVASEGEARHITGVNFIRKYSLASSSAVQTAANKLKSMDLLTVSDGAYHISDPMFRIYLRRLANPSLRLID